jgi:hypothetical protein
MAYQGEQAARIIIYLLPPHRPRVYHRATASKALRLESSRASAEHTHCDAFGNQV